MLVDKVTLNDLSIFHSDEEQSVFHHLNFTNTNGGRAFLKHLLANPLNSIESIIDTQKTIGHLQTVTEQWPINPSNGSIMVLEKFYDTQIDHYPTVPDAFNSLFYQYFHKSDYSLTLFTVQHSIDFLKGLQIISNLISTNEDGKQLVKIAQRIQLILNKDTIQTMIGKDRNKLSATEVLTYANFIRFHFKLNAFELFELYYKLDAYLSLAKAGSQYGLCFPTISNQAEPFVDAEGLYHFMLHTPIAYKVDLSINANFLFLTGANMAGKSTFIKAAGVAVYLAHIGMGVPAKKMQLSYFDGLLSNIQVTDNIAKGESFFFNEVQRIKNTIQKINDEKKWLILIDELFKGTNQQDAVKCSTTVIEGLLKLKNALFILSTHLYEIGEPLKKYSNIQFRYFETAVENDQLIFSYQLKEGISNDRLGYLILKREGVVALLEKL